MAGRGGLDVLDFGGGQRKKQVESEDGRDTEVSLQIFENEAKTAQERSSEVGAGDRVGVDAIALKTAVANSGKRRGRRPGFVFSPRDLDVLEWICVQRWSTQEILLDAFYSKPNPDKILKGRKPNGKYGRERLWELEREGYIQPSRFRVGSVVPLLVSPRGYSVLHGQGRVEWAHPFPDIDASRFEHELMIQRLRLLLAKHGATDWRSERQLSWVNRVQHLAFVPDAQFKASGWTWNLEIERTLKSKKRRKQSFEVRERHGQRFLYVVPESIWPAVRETIGVLGFEAGLYWFREADAKQDQMTVRCKWGDWGEYSLAALLDGRFEPDLARRRMNHAIDQAHGEFSNEFLNLANSIQRVVEANESDMSDYAQQLTTRKKGVLGIGAEKIPRPRFRSLSEIEKGIEAMTLRRRQYRMVGRIELDQIKQIENAFYAYAKQMQAVNAVIDKAIADGEPKAFQITKGKELVLSLGILTPRIR